MFHVKHLDESSVDGGGADGSKGGADAEQYWLRRQPNPRTFARPKEAALFSVGGGPRTGAWHSTSTEVHVPRLRTAQVCIPTLITPPPASR